MGTHNSCDVLLWWSTLSLSFFPYLSLSMLYMYIIIRHSKVYHQEFSDGYYILIDLNLNQGRNCFRVKVSFVAQSYQTRNAMLACRPGRFESGSTKSRRADCEDQLGKVYFLTANDKVSQQNPPLEFVSRSKPKLLLKRLLWVNMNKSNVMFDFPFGWSSYRRPDLFPTNVIEKYVTAFSCT